MVKTISSELNKIKNAKKTETKNKDSKSNEKREKRPLTFKCKPEHRDRLQKLCERLAQSEKGAELLAIAKEAGVSLSMAKGGNDFGYFDERTNKITLGQEFNDDRLIGTFAHELTHAKQFSRNALAVFGYHNAKSHIMLQRAAEADADANGIAVCYELAQKGDKGPLNEYRKESSGAASAYENNLDKGQDIAMFAAYKAWYTDRKYVNGYTESYLEMINAEEDLDLYKFNKSVQPSFVAEKICEINGKSYFKDDPSILETVNFLGVKKETKENFVESFKVFGIRDKSVKELLVYGDKEQTPAPNILKNKKTMDR